MAEHDDRDPRPWRAPTWRDAAVSLAAFVLAAFVALPACAGPGLGVRDAIALGPDLVRLEVRLAGGLAAPVALWVLARRLRRPDPALRPAERYLVHAAALIGSTLACLALVGPGRPLVAIGAGAASSVALGPWLLAHPWWLGAWRGVKAAGLAFVGGAALGVLGGFVLGVFSGALGALLGGGGGTGPPWVTWCWELLVPTAMTSLMAAGAWAAAAEYDGMPDRPANASVWGWATRSDAP